jgi:hypothetical protein
MFLIVGYEWDKGLSADETRQALDRMMAWFDKMLKSGVATGGSPLARHGKIVGGKNGNMVADGPFAEAKEVVGGYISIRAESLEAATALARQCPLLEYGVTLDVREMVNECAISVRLKEQAALATA